ncbi:c-type cytochrome [Pseudomonas sp. M30-35]|uniref:c-type cytochrome n=1 Tax=Pseudomonas sp. M30-35 TaxID=1981174 RepID=UPI000B3C3902|nr:c-type cytochrome [Pseudomonas sp. M30-35]ARU90773.1 cytochrome c [Pseudomonas sp. M30-35]
MHKLLPIGSLLTLLLANYTSAAEVPEAAQSCVICHGAQGQGTTQGPKLAGLSSSYMNAQIEHFISGDRKNVIMTLMAQSLVDLNVRQQALDYYATQGTAPKLHKRGDVLNQSGAEKLYYQGDLHRSLPACYSCHGPSAVGGGLFPRLAGQQSSYLKDQLIAWQNKERSGDPDNTMGHIASKLKDSEIQALADYLSAIK